MKKNFDRYLPIFTGLGFSLIFGFSFMFTKNVLEVINPFRLLGFRFSLAALGMTLLWAAGFLKLNYRNKELKWLFILALTQPVLYFIFETLGINRTTSSEAGLMISLIPIAVTILATIFLEEKPHRKQLPFIILSVIGVIFIVIMKGRVELTNNLWGMLLLGGAVLMAGVYNILSRKLSLNFKPVEITFVMLWVGALVFNCLALIEYTGSWGEYFRPLGNYSVLVPVIYLGLLSSLAAFFMMNFTLSRIRAFESAVFANLVTVIAIFAGVVFRNEPFYWFQAVGAVMIITGVWGTNYYGELKTRAEELPS